MSGKNKKTNGSGNGHDKEDKVVHFPSFAERKKKTAWRDIAPKKSNDAPFFNFGHIPLMTKTVVILFVAIHVIIQLLPPDLKMQIIYTFGFVPAYITGMIEPDSIGVWFSPITHIFIHGGWMHLAFNCVMALSLGMFFEREFGTRATIIFFFSCGLCGAVSYFILNPYSTVPVIGASGAISGLFGALIVLMGQRGNLGPQKYGPWPLVIFWVVFMIGAGMMTGDNTAWQAHIGGFLMGIALLHLMQKGHIKL